MRPRPFRRPTRRQTTLTPATHSTRNPTRILTPALLLFPSDETDETASEDAVREIDRRPSSTRREREHAPDVD